MLLAQRVMPFRMLIAITPALLGLNAALKWNDHTFWAYAIGNSIVLFAMYCTVGFFTSDGHD